MAAPVSFGEALSKGKDAAFANYVPLLIGTLICAVPILGLLCAPGLMYMGLKAVRGQKPEIGDVFISLKERLVDHLIMTILTGLCCIVTLPLFWSGNFMLLDKKAAGWNEAMNKSMNENKASFVGILIMLIVISLPSICFLLAPVTICAMAYAYDKMYGGGEAKAD